MRTFRLVLATAAFVSGCVPSGQPTNLEGSLQQQVMEAERAFARSMADRDHVAFASFLSEEAIFFSGEVPTRGKEAVAAEWKPYFEAATPPFSWEPDRVEVLDSGSLAFSTGPVYDGSGTVVGRFNSVWRQEAPGQWRVVFDKGSTVCACPAEGTR